MSIRTFPRKLMALCLGVVLVSCSATRPTAVVPGPTGPYDLHKYALLIQRAPDGRVTHDWKPLEDFDLTHFQSAWGARSSSRGIVHVSSAGLAEYCEGRRRQCMQDCLSSRSPIKVGNSKYEDVKTTPWRVVRGRWCQEKCTEQAVQCTRRRGEWAEEYAAEFSAMEPAVDWLKTHREEIVVGTAIVIAGVVFVAVVAASGGGALVLVPLVFLTESPMGPPAAFPLAEVAR